MSNTIGLLVFDDAEELDFIGPWEVFTMSNEVLGLTSPDQEKDTVFLISETGGTIRCAKGLRVETDHSLESCPALDVLLIPGGQGTRREVHNEKLMSFIAAQDKDTTWMTSVCTGSLLLTAAGPAKGKRVTTHWGFIDDLRKRGDAGDVVENIRYVRDGKVVTAAGVSAGIDMALWLVGQIHGVNHARHVQKGMEYDPAPPYTADV